MENSSATHANMPHNSSALLIKIDLPPQPDEERANFHEAVEALSHLVMNAGGTVKVEAVADSDTLSTLERTEILHNFADKLGKHFAWLNNSLSTRTREALGHLMKGCTNAEIGEAMGIKQETVRDSYVHRVAALLGGGDRGYWVSRALCGEIILDLVQQLDFGLNTESTSYTEDKAQDTDMAPEQIVVNASFVLPNLPSEQALDVSDSLRDTLSSLATDLKSTLEMSATVLGEHTAQSKRREILEIYGESVVRHFTALRALLSPRRQETLYYLSQGLSLDEVAAAMFISSHTAKANQEWIGGVLGGGNRYHIIARALQPDATLKLAEDLGVGLTVERNKNGK